MENIISPESVAEAMVDLVQDARYGGGSCLEVSVAGRRLLGTWNMEAPDEGTVRVPQEVKYAPIFARLSKERSLRVMEVERQVSGQGSSIQSHQLRCQK